MPRASELARTVIDGNANALATRIGRNLELLVLNRAAALAAQETKPGGPILITIDHVQTSLVECLPEDVVRQIGVLADGETGPGESRSLPV